ncbi:trigger factor [Conexibacter sp. SYSU D00693]|uniref:trigger factor n=1 Tax=Conexibacter sp. SYSU D00693 TaxID=2812560 RepID=UPI00196B4AF8|nr:trigger factor [Conexibacter sp. SYSU D00693]
MAAASPVKTTVTELPESRVRVEAEVPADEVGRRMAETARRLGRDLRVQGFRRGKVPPPVVIQRVGREAVLDETVRGSLGRWYADAVTAAGISPIGDPDVDLGDLPAEGQPLTFTIEIGVRPTAQLGDYKGLQVAKREAQADDEAVQAQIDQLRESMARLETVERAAETGDFVVMDFAGSIDGELFEGGSGNDQMIELGGGRLVPGFEEQLVGAKAGDEVEVTVTFPEEYLHEAVAGKDAVFQVTVKEVKAKELPELDDEFASDAAGFDTLDELREDIANKLKETDEARADAEYREAVLDAAVAGATVEIPDALVEARARELFDRTAHQLSHQGISREAFLQMSGKTEDEIVEDGKSDAEQALKREAVLAAIVEAEELKPSDGDVLDALQASAAREGVSVEKLRDRLERDGRLAELEEDLAQRAALDLLVEHAADG